MLFKMEDSGVRGSNKKNTFWLSHKKSDFFRLLKDVKIDGKKMFEETNLRQWVRFRQKHTILKVRQGKLRQMKFLAFQKDPRLSCLM
jgi:hypothetical protein